MHRTAVLGGSTLDALAVLPLPPNCAELKVVKNIRQFARENWVSNRAFRNDDDIVDHCGHSRTKLSNQRQRIMSSGLQKEVYKL